MSYNVDFLVNYNFLTVYSCFFQKILLKSTEQLKMSYL